MGFNNGPKLVTQGLDLLIDAADPASYPGSGTVWRDLRSGTTGSLTGSVSYTSEFYGGLTFSNSSSAVIFPGSTANYGTSSFTVEMAFKPTFINGRHYLMSKNSGSFPNWAIYLSGSSGQGKLWSEFRINASVSCSYSSSTVFQTGSVYQVDVRILPGVSASGIYVNGATEFGTIGNGGGSLSSTSSLFVGNYSQNNTQNFSGSIYTIKSYLNASVEQPVINYNATATRLSRIPASDTGKRFFELLIVGGGGGGANQSTDRGNGGGGAGGLQYITNFIPNTGGFRVIVGNGGAVRNNGQNSSYDSLVSTGGGAGGYGDGGNGANGGSGGGGGHTGIGGLGTVGQGNNGGPGQNYGQGGGGGGAGTPGTVRNGGSGSYITSFAAIGGSPAGWFAGGGGGGAYGGASGGIGGIGGAGNGGSSGQPGLSGSANTGGGGGGSGTGAFTGGAGGSGIVAIRYSGTPIAVGGEITQSAGFTYHVFRTVGTSSLIIF